MSPVIMDPTGTSEEQQSELASRTVRDLNGKKVGLLDSSKANSDLLLDAIGELLEQRYQVKEFVRGRKASFFIPAAPEVVEQFADCDVVITGVGDWGSCSAASVADGILFERRGIQAASIVTDPFTRSSDAMAKRQGFPGYRYVMIKHPLSSLTPDECRQRAEEALGDILSVLGLAEEAIEVERAAVSGG